MYAASGAVMPRRNEALPKVTVHPQHDESTSIKTVQWIGKEKVQVVDSPKPLITDAEDAVIKISSSCICGSDLHLYLAAMPGMKKGDILGHENMGIVESVGPGCRSLGPGDRVVVAFDIACGGCHPCQKGIFSGCDSTNPSKEQELLYGHRTAGLFGYSQLTGGYEGGQAEFLRVPLADVNCLKLPPESELLDEQVVLISDVLSTAWHANELGSVGQGDSVAIWVVLIDEQAYRLEFAKDWMPELETINFSERKTLEALHEMFKDEEGRYIGPDVAIEAVGFHYAHSWIHKVEMALNLENDPSEILNELIYAVRKGGRISIVGVYSGYSNHFNIGAFMEKGLSMGAGQTPVQKYWRHLLQLVREGTLHPERVITHTLPLEEAPRAYKMFNGKTDGCIKVMLKPGGAAPQWSE